MPFPRFYSRRKFLATAASLFTGLPLMSRLKAKAGAAPVLQKRGQTPAVVVSSANGLEAVKVTYRLMSKGTDTLEAVISGVNLVESDPNDRSVGYGGLPNEEGVVELDSAVMHGPTHRAGAVAALRNIRKPSRVAQLVLETTDHVLLVGAGALKFAKANGIKEEELLTEASRKAWLKWKRNLSRGDDWLSDDEEDRGIARYVGRPTGTIHCAALNSDGDISCVTTTSGLAYKIPGRVGDSPIIGAGLYVDNAIGSCGSTGRGEANLQNLCSFAAVELMGTGMSPEEAGMAVLRRVASHTTQSRLLDGKGRPNFGLKFYIIAKDGRYAGVSMWGPAKYSVATRKGSRHEEMVYLYTRGS